MRLTTLAHMDIPEGRVSSYAVHVAPSAGQDLPVSFDQARHVGAGQRPGSWMAVAFCHPYGVSRTDLAETWLKVIDRHGTLRTIFSPGPRLSTAVITRGEWLEHPIPGRDGRERTTREVLHDVLDATCAPYSRPAYRLCLVDPVVRDARRLAVIGLDHSHADAWSLMVLVRDLLRFLSPGDEPIPPRPPAFAEHTAALISRPPAPAEVHRRWREILSAGGGVMPVFPLDLGDLSQPRPEIVEVRDVLDPQGVGGLEQAARERAVRLLALAMSVLTATLTDRGSGPVRAVFPVHSRYEPRWHDSVGWFITNSVIECPDPDPTACADAVREAIRLGSYPLAPIMAAYGGMPASPGMFAISWLDNRRMPVQVDPAVDAQHVSANIRTDGVMIWFVVDHEGLHLRCRYPDTPQARETMGTWLEDVCAGLRDYAGH